MSHVRHARPGEPIALRADDVVALSAAIGQDTMHVEARIVELLGCTPYEAKSLHAEMLRRKLVVPVAGLVAGLVIVGGVGMRERIEPGSRAHPHTVGTGDRDGRPGRAAEPRGRGAPTTRRAPTTTQPAKARPRRPSRRRHRRSSEPDAAETVAEPNSHPVVTPDTTPMGIPPHETVTIIQP